MDRKKHSDPYNVRRIGIHVNNKGGGYRLLFMWLLLIRRGILIESL